MEWGLLWEWFKDEQNREILAWFGGIGSAIIVAGWALFTYSRDHKRGWKMVNTSENDSPAQKKPLAQKAGGSIRQKSGRNITHGDQEAGGDITQEADRDITHRPAHK